MEGFEFEVVHVVSLWAFVLAALFGFVANKTNFCVMGAISDLLHIGSTGRLGAWLFAAGIAVIGTQILSLTEVIDLDRSIYLGPRLGWLGHIVGGLAFGVGMTLAAGCGQRNLVRVGSGSLKALVVLLVLGITAYTTLRGLLGLLRIGVFQAPDTDLARYGIEDQSVASLLAAISGAEAGAVDTLRLVLALILGIGLVAFSLSRPAFRRNADHLLAGFVVGGVIVGGWYLTGRIGNDDFDPVPLESMTFVAPTGNTINYLMTFTGSTINFGIAAVLGMIGGSLAYSLLSGGFRIETFSNRSEMVRHLIGAVLMGFGGVLALGCTIGQGVTGLSTLAIGSLITVPAIFIGSAMTMRTEYHMLDEHSLFVSLRMGLEDALMPWRAADR
ncbi:YeeE/YedE family protein [Thioalkalivibrio sp. HK1]|uniref:YeeE/YedE family protein n=1 Tax=Thioalkalivibrio sp. HK1 TaxID=1469245 RepID=UPI0004705720|nr:YeeE/YedE family protein [Thioalkalivibrio sp. HK1]